MKLFKPKKKKNFVFPNSGSNVAQFEYKKIKL